jgi:hypothetical protein
VFLLCVAGYLSICVGTQLHLYPLWQSALGLLPRSEGVRLEGTCGCGRGCCSVSALTVSWKLGNFLMPNMKIKIHIQVRAEPSALHPARAQQMLLER